MEFELGVQTEWVHGLCLIWPPNAIVSCILISPVKRVFFMYWIKEWMEFTLMCGNIVEISKFASSLDSSHYQLHCGSTVSRTNMS